MLAKRTALLTPPIFEAEFVKTRCENSLCFIFFVPFYREWTTTHLFGFGAWLLRRRLRRNDQTPKSVTLLSAQRSWLKANNGINGRGPPEAGRMPFMPAVSLNQRSGALPKRDPLLS
jgi:hypothetical protein